ncbi:MAG: hypothetical protein V2I47_12730 [Bacteroidales bacterium]|jgi:hypothetical protein|nr:hypothetical protein [Bacteroidales bacterium]
MKKTFKYIIPILIAAAVFSACRKENKVDDNPSLKLEFSTDSIIFDTVFTTVGSITRYVKVYNRHANAVNISSIRLQGGQASSYRINIDGQPSVQEKDVEIAGNDSLFVFIRVTIDPTSGLTPFVVSDEISFLTNGNEQKVVLAAWGQDAHYIVADKEIGSIKYKIVAAEDSAVTWPADKPYLIYGYAVVDSTGSLTIEEGAQIHFHNKSGMWIYKGGSLKVMGTKDAPVVFQQDRLEPYFRDLPGQWDRIWINEGSVDNEINYAVIRNGFIGLQAETLQEPMGNMLTLTNTIIENMSGIGILGRYYAILGVNNVVVNCGQLGLLLQGGVYDFRQCTFANYFRDGIRQDPNLAITNFYIDPNEVLYVYNTDAYFGNSIIYGDKDEEILISGDEQGSLDYTFDHCLLKTTLGISNDTLFPGSVKNEDPIFVDADNNNMALDSLSPGIDMGSIEVINNSQLPTIIDKDILGVSRIASPDMGAYEYIPD